MSHRNRIRFQKLTRIEPDTISNTSLNSSVGANVCWTPILASRSGQLISVGLNFKTAAGNHRLAIYSTAGALLGESSSTAVVTGWNNLAISGVSIVANTEYLLALQISSTSAIIYYRGAPTGFWAYKAQVYGAFPATLPAGSTVAAVTPNMRLTYT